MPALSYIKVTLCLMRREKSHSWFWMWREI